MNKIVQKEENLIIPGPEGQLEARIFSNASAEQVFGIVCHPHPLYQGTMDNKVVTTLIRAFQSLGLSTLRFNFRGVGESEGTYGEGKGEVEDLKAIIQWILSEYPKASFWLAGFSFGAYVAAFVATQLENSLSLKGLISIAPAIRLFDFLSLTPPRCPWIIFQGDEDELVAIQDVQQWFEKYKNNMNIRPVFPLELIIIPGASHFFHGQLINLKNRLIEALNPFL